MFSRSSSNVHAYSGFTIIELLIVIAMITILAGVVLAGLSSGRVRARNAKRTGDVTQLIVAFNAYAHLNNNFPSTNGTPVLSDDSNVFYCVSTTCGGLWPNNQNSAVNNAIDDFIEKATDKPDSRALSGYVYNSKWPAGNSPYDGTTFSPGVYLDFALEVVPITGTTCLPGRIWLVTATYIECLVRLN